MSDYIGYSISKGPRAAGRPQKQARNHGWNGVSRHRRRRRRQRWAPLGSRSLSALAVHSPSFLFALFSPLPSLSPLLLSLPRSLAPALSKLSPLCGSEEHRASPPHPVTHLPLFSPFLHFSLPAPTSPLLQV